MSSYFQTILVLSDQYPPDVLGGAELSLHSLLKGMNYHDKKVVVVALSNRAGREMYDGIEVIRVPFQYDWPTFVQQPSRTRRLRAFASEAGRALAARNTDFFPLASTAYQIHRSHRSLLGAFPHVDQQVLKFNKVVEEIKELVRRIRPSLVHADNYKSIALAHSAGIDVPVVSLVRDNRFFCAHKNQASNILGEICTTCEFACVEGKTTAAMLPKVKDVMRQTLAFRVEALQASTTVVATSGYLASKLSGLGLPNVHVVRNPVENADTVAAMQKGISRADPPEILCVGMLSHNKGQFQLVQALPAFRERLRDFKLVLAGRGAMASRLEAMARDLGLRDHLVITGFLDRPALYRSYARSSVVVCPNIWPEPFGRVPLEAAMSKRPVVAFNTGATSEQIEHGVTGWMVDALDMDSLVERAVFAIENPAVAERIGSTAHAALLKKQSQDNPSARLFDIWMSSLQPA